MIILRAVERRDEIPLARLSQLMEQGLTSLPRHPIDLEKRIERSIESFAKKRVDGSEIYLFVLEDLEHQQLIGTAQIIAKTLGSTLGYYYKQEPYVQAENRLQGTISVPFLRPTRHLVESSELGGLFLHPQTRHKGLSKLLSLSRLFFITSYPERFEPNLIAEMRGFTDENGLSPFWNAIGCHFLHIHFDELMRQVAQDPSFIPDILPPFPICLHMLPLEVQKLAGRTHPQSETALQRLLGEGFKHTGEIDIFDGGPKITADVQSLKIWRTRKTARAICGKLPEEHQEEVLISNHHPQFRVCMTSICIQSPETILIDPAVAKLLEISTGELVHYLPIHPHDTLEHL